MLTLTSSVRRYHPAAAAVLALAALTAAGCGSSSSSPGASAASSAASQAGSAASSAASQAGNAASSAASSAMAKIKGGVDATADVTAGAVSIDSDGRATCKLTVKNSTTDSHDYTISVSFDDPNGNVLDATVVNISNVAANGDASGTARSNRDLTGSLTAKVTAALRH